MGVGVGVAVGKCQGIISCLMSAVLSFIICKELLLFESFAKTDLQLHSYNIFLQQIAQKKEE